MLNNFYKKSLATQKLQFFRKTLQESLLYGGIKSVAYH